MPAHWVSFSSVSNWTHILKEVLGYLGLRIIVIKWDEHKGVDEDNEKRPADEHSHAILSNEWPKVSKRDGQAKPDPYRQWKEDETPSYLGHSHSDPFLE